MNLLKSTPRLSIPPLGKALLGAALFLSLGTATQAEKFFLAIEGGGVQYGPVEYQEGAKMVVADKTFVMVKESAPGGGDMEQKLQSIILPSINLSNAKVEIVVQFLQQRSIELDTSSPKKGVSLVLKLD